MYQRHREETAIAQWLWPWTLVLARAVQSELFITEYSIEYLIEYSNDTGSSCYVTIGWSRTDTLFLFKFVVQQRF